MGSNPMSDEEFTEEEKHEAEALARALDGETPHSATSPALLETAALLRHAGAKGALSPERAGTIASQLKAASQPRPKRRGWILTAFAGSAAVAAVVALMILPTTRRQAPSSSVPPRPSLNLLKAQAGAARGGRQALDALDAEMRAYRT